MKEVCKEQIDLERTLQSNTKPPTKSTTEQSEYISRKEAAATADVCISTINNRVKEGVIKTYKFGARVLIKRKDLDLLIIPGNF